MSRSIVANLINRVMIDSAPSAYARVMAAVTPRKLWQAMPGDCVVTLAPCTEVFREYVETVTGVQAGSVELIMPARLTPASAYQVIEMMGAAKRVASRPTLSPFVTDEESVRFAKATGMNLEHYSQPPGLEVIAAVRRVNTKAGFREIASSLGLPVAPGGTATTRGQLAEDLPAFVKENGPAIVKINRSSNGYGTFVVGTQDLGRLATQIARLPSWSSGWVYEKHLPFLAVPSVELFVDSCGVRHFYTCDQRTRDNAWTGMVTPPDRALPRAVVDAAYRIGEWLRLQGYCGYFDVDAGVLDDGFVVTEANVRRTGGTYLHDLARKISGEHQVHWCADARSGATGLSFAQALRRIDQAGLQDHAAPVRAVLVADTLEIDGRWRYLIAGAQADAVAEAEICLARLLELK